jgi:hypothetical protein
MRAAPQRPARAVSSPQPNTHTLSLPVPQEKLDKSLYTSPKEFKHDVNLVWNNCMTYNAVRVGRAGPAEPARAARTQTSWAPLTFPRR